MKNLKTLVTEPSGETRECGLGVKWQSLAYMDPFQRAVGHFFSAKAIACTIRNVAS